MSAMPRALCRADLPTSFTAEQLRQVLAVLQLDDPRIKVQSVSMDVHSTTVTFLDPNGADPTLEHTIIALHRS